MTTQQRYGPRHKAVSPMHEPLVDKPARSPGQGGTLRALAHSVRHAYSSQLLFVASGDIVSRVLALGFYVVVARMMSSADYGTLRFALVLGTLGVTVVASISSTLAR